MNHTEKQNVPELRFAQKEKINPRLRFKQKDGTDFPDWEMKQLGEVAVVNPNSNGLPVKFIYIDLESVNKGSLQKEVEILLSEAPSRAQRWLEKEDILFQTVRPYQRNNLLFNLDGKYVASTGYAQLRYSKSSKFLYQLIHTDTFVNNVLKRCTGTSYPAISSNDLSNIVITIPSLPEQQKIADFLSAVDKRIELLEEKKQQIERYKKGLMQQLFPQKGEKNPRLRFKQKDGTDFPDWEMKKLGEVCTIKRGASPRPISDPKWFDKNSSIGWVRISDVTNSNKVLSSTEQSLSDIGVKKSRLIKKGNLIMSICATIGKPVYTGIDVCIHDGFVVFSDLTENHEFLYYYLQKIEKNWYRYGQPGIQLNLNTEIIKSENIHFPSLPEQQKIADCLSAVDQKIEQTTKQIKHTKQFKKALLQKMFV